MIDLPGYKIIPITRDNHMGVWPIYQSNANYLNTRRGGILPPSPADILHTFDRLVEGYDPAAQYFVGIWKGSEPVAVLELLPDFPSLGTLWLSEIIVRGDLRGTGLGSAIVSNVIAGAVNFERIFLGVDDGNKDVIGFWAKHGFINKGDYYERH